MVQYWIRIFVYLWKYTFLPKSWLYSLFKVSHLFPRMTKNTTRLLECVLLSCSSITLVVQKSQNLDQPCPSSPNANPKAHRSSAWHIFTCIALSMNITMRRRRRRRRCWHSLSSLSSFFFSPKPVPGYAVTAAPLLQTKVQKWKLSS